MQDYKRLIGGKFKTLEKDINRSFRGFRVLRMELPVLAFFRALKEKKAALIAVAAAVLCLSAVTAALLSGLKGPVRYGVSYLGDLKVRQEFQSMDNPEARGGNEIRNFDTNNSELRFFFYKIKQGESLYTISRKLGVSMDTLISLNTMDNAHNLGEGRRIIVPNLQGILYAVKKGDTLDSISAKYKINVADILDANDLTDTEIARTEIFEGEMLFLPGAQLTEKERAKILGYLFNKPIRGRFTSGFGIRKDPFTGLAGYHPGIDISAPYGSTVFSSKEGRVVFTGWYGGYGKCVIIRHLFGFETVYGHLSSIGVKKDQWLKAGQYLGRVGSTGRSTGAHLHFEVRKYGRPINPVRLSGLAKSGNRRY